MDGRDAETAPLPTQTTSTRAAVVHCRGVAELQRHGDVRSISEPVHTVRAGGQHHGLVMANTENHVPKDADTSPVPTIRTEGGAAMVLTNLANNVPKLADREPSAPILTGPHQAVVMRNNNSRGNSGAMLTPAHEPVRALTTAGHQSLIVPYDRTGEARPAELEPTGTLTTRDRVALVLTDEQIDDCRFRMFALHEIANAMALRTRADGSEYVVTGNKRERMAQYGNAVTPPVMQWIVSRLLPVLDEASTETRA